MSGVIKSSLIKPFSGDIKIDLQIYKIFAFRAFVFDVRKKWAS